MKTVNLVYLVAAGWLAFVPARSAGDEIPGLYGTGVLNDNSLAPDGSPDLHYALIASPTGPGTAYVTYAATLHELYDRQPRRSKWISPAPNLLNYPPGEWTYRITFDLTGLLPQTARITGLWAADDDARLLLNGLSVAALTNGWNFTNMTSFAITNGFLEGTNVLDFVVENHGSPTALRVDGLRGTAINVDRTVLSIRCSQVELCWFGISNRQYVVQYRSELTTNQWVNLSTQIAGMNDYVCLTDAVAPVQRFYRLQILP